MKALLPFIFLLCLAQQAHAQPIVLEHADSLVGFKAPSGEAARRVVGNVQLTQGNVIITCNRATQFPQSNIAELTGNVKFVQDTLTILTEHATYDGTTKIVRSDVPLKLYDGVATLTAKSGIYVVPEAKAIFTRDVTVLHDSTHITAKEITYYRHTQRSLAEGHARVVNDSLDMRAEHMTHNRISGETFARTNVWLKSNRTSTIALADSIAHFSQKHYTYFAPHPVLIKIDSVQSADSVFTFDTLFVRSVWMEAFHDTMNERYVAHTNVEILRGTLGAKSTLADYNANKGQLLLTGTPIAWFDSTQLSGDTIVAVTSQHNDGRSLDKIEARNAAFGVMRSDSLYPLRFDQLSGNVISILVDHDTARAIVSTGNALGVYFGYDEKSPRGTTRSSGDRITFNLNNKKAERVVIASGTEGKYFPEKMVRRREQEYRLLGFSWRDDRPVKPILPPTP